MSFKKSLSVATLALGLAAFPLLSQTSPYTRTILVGGSGTATANGTALLSAVAGITSPSATNRWLVKVEPGTFDFGSSILQLRSYVDLEGSGRGMTTLVSSSANSTVYAPTDAFHTDVNSEVRDLQVRNTASNASGIAVEVNGIRLTRVDAVSDSAAGGAAINLANTTARLTEVSATSRASNSNGSVVGVWIVGGKPTLQDVTVTTDGATGGIHRGIAVNSSPALLQRVNVTAPLDPTTGYLVEGVAFASGAVGAVLADSQVAAGANSTSGSGQAFAIYVADASSVEIRNTVATTQNSWWSPALYVSNGTSSTASVVNVDGSRLRGQGGNGIGCQTYGVATVRFHASIVEGTSLLYLINATGGTGTINFGASQLVGTRTYPFGGPFATCADSYDGGATFTPIANGPC